MANIKIEDIAKLLQGNFKVDVSHQDIKVGQRTITVNYLTLISKENGQAILISTNNILETATVLYSEALSPIEVRQEFMGDLDFKAFCDIAAIDEEVTASTMLRAANLADIIGLNKVRPVAHKH